MGNFLLHLLGNLHSFPDWWSCPVCRDMTQGCWISVEKSGLKKRISLLEKDITTLCIVFFFVFVVYRWIICYTTAYLVMGMFAVFTDMTRVRYGGVHIVFGLTGYNGLNYIYQFYDFIEL